MSPSPQNTINTQEEQFAIIKSLEEKLKIKIPQVEELNINTDVGYMIDINGEIVELVLNDCNVQNEDLTLIGQLKSLTDLQLGKNQITEIKDLESLTNLTALNLSNNKINKIERLQNLTCLTDLWLDRNKITEIIGLEALANLEVLALDGNQISELKQVDKLQNLKKLKTLYLQNNNIQGADMEIESYIKANFPNLNWVDTEFLLSEVTPQRNGSDLN